METTNTHTDFSSDPELITGIDPVSINLLRQFYISLKTGNINPSGWVKEIEKTYNNKQSSDSTLLNGLDELLNQAYELLHPDCRNWQSSREELYAIFERIIFLKAREDVFKDYFDELEKTATAAMLLDFSKRVTPPKIITQEGNVFDYAATIFNMLLEKIQESVVSSNAVNTILSTTPTTITVVTDIHGKIRFLNKLGEILLGVECCELINQPVKAIFLNYSTIEKELKVNEQVKDMTVSIGFGEKNYPARLTIKKTVTKAKEIEEFVYILHLQNYSSGEL